MNWWKAERGEEGAQRVARRALTKACTITLGSICLGSIAASPLTLLRVLCPVPPLWWRQADEQKRNAKAKTLEVADAEEGETYDLTAEERSAVMPGEAVEEAEDGEPGVGVFDDVVPKWWFWGKLPKQYYCVRNAYFRCLVMVWAVLDNLSRMFNTAAFAPLHVEPKRYLVVASQACHLSSV